MAIRIGSLIANNNGGDGVRIEPGVELDAKDVRAEGNGGQGVAISRHSPQLGLPSDTDPTSLAKPLQMLKSDEIKSQLERLIVEAAKVAPSIICYNDAKNYGIVTDEGSDTQAMQRWELEAVALLNQLDASGADVFRQLHSNAYAGIPEVPQ